MEYLKNPIIAGLLTSGIIYLYLKINAYYTHIQNPDLEQNDISMKYPIILGVIIFLSLSLWQTYQKNKQLPSIKVPVAISSSSPDPSMNVAGIGSVMPTMIQPSIFTGVY